VLRPAGDLGLRWSRNGGRGRRSLWSSARWPPPVSRHQVAWGRRACGRRCRPRGLAADLHDEPVIEQASACERRRDPRRVGRASGTVLRPAGGLGLRWLKDGDVVAVRCGRARGGHRRCLGTGWRVVVVPVVAVADPGSGRRPAPRTGDRTVQRLRASSRPRKRGQGLGNCPSACGSASGCGGRGTGDVVAVRGGRARGGHRRCLGTGSLVVVVPVVAVVIPGIRLPSCSTQRLARFYLRSCQGPVEQGVL